MNVWRSALAVLTTTVAVSVGWVGASSGAAPSPLGRDQDPVVVSGADVPNLVGVRPAGLVAFRYDGGWQQVPVQVDERAPVDLATIYRQPPNGVVRTVYTDPNTWTGADPQVLVAQRIRFMGRNGEVFGVIGKKPIHLIKPEEREKASKITDLLIEDCTITGSAKPAWRPFPMARPRGWAGYSSRAAPHSRACASPARPASRAR